VIESRVMIWFDYKKIWVGNMLYDLDLTWINDGLIRFQLITSIISIHWSELNALL